MSGLTVATVDPRTDHRWHDLSLFGSLFTSPPWISAVSGCYGFEPTARIAFDGDDRPVAGLAWTDVDDLRGSRRIALPFGDRADPILRCGEESATGQEAWEAVSADALAGDRTTTLRCLDGSPAVRDARLSVIGEAAWHRTPLDCPIDELHSRFRPQTRRNIANAERSGVRVELHDGIEAVQEYHRLQVHLRRTKYGLLAQPREFFEEIWKAFAPGDAIRVGLAYVGGRPVAGVVYLLWGGTAYYKFGASRADYLDARPNDGLHWAMIRWARERGLEAIDWGLSDLDQPGLVRYKRNWAAHEGRIRTLSSAGASDRSDATTRELTRLLGDLTGLFTDPAVPDRITDAAGALLYRYFC